MERYAVRTDGAVGPGDAVKDKAFVFAHFAGGNFRIGFQPFFYVAHGGFAGVDVAFFKQNAADAFKRVAVIVGIADANRSSVGQSGNGRTLNLHDVDVDIAVTPKDNRCGDVVFFNFFAGIIRNQFLIFYAADKTFGRQRRIKIARVKFYQIQRFAVDGKFVNTGLNRRGVNGRFVIRSKFSLIGTVGNYQKRQKVAFKKIFEFHGGGDVRIYQALTSQLVSGSRNS